jgi:hypothetical protein
MKQPKLSTPEHIETPPNFELKDPISGKLIRYDVNYAIRWISRHPSLQIEFAEIGYRRIDYLESVLWLDGSISISAKNGFRLELTELQNEASPIWENAIRSTRTSVSWLISSTIRRWMHASNYPKMRKRR